MINYTIKPLCLGHILRPKNNMIYQSEDNSKIQFPLIAYYAEWGNHKILIDTGGAAPDGKRWMPYTRTVGESMEAQLKKIRVRPEEIDAVILTHLHWDHAGNNQLFPNAKFYVQSKEAADLHKPGVDTALVEKTPYTLIYGDTDLFPGVRLVLAPGHSPGMQCVLIQTAQGEVMLTGDLLPLYENWESKMPNGVFYDLDVINSSILKVSRLCSRILPGHDSKVFEPI
ncbi:MAG: N-acyl homoserine lactonase family protein [Bacillota bacterium]